MIFRRLSKYAEVSEDGAYSVSAGKVYGVLSYLAHRRIAPKKLLGKFEHAREARTVCEVDAQKGA